MSVSVVRAFELPIQHTSEETWEILRQCQRESVTLANWCVQYLLRHDVQVLPGQDKLPKMPPLPKGGLYRVAGDAFGLMRQDSFWAGAAGSFSAITKAVTD